MVFLERLTLFSDGILGSGVLVCHFLATTIESVVRCHLYDPGRAFTLVGHPSTHPQASVHVPERSVCIEPQEPGNGDGAF